MNLPFVCFHRWRYINLLFAQKAILWAWKTRPLCMNLENVEKGKVTTQKMLVLKPCSILDFIQNIIFQKLKIRLLFATYLHPWKNHFSGKRHGVFVSRQNKLDWKSTCDDEERCQILSEQVHLQYFSGCKSIYMEVVVIDNFNKLKPCTISMA